MTIIAICASKGGTGKTTTAVNIAGCMVETGLSVLLIDMDPQGDATKHLGAPVGGDDLLGQLHAATALTWTATASGVDLVAGGPALDVLPLRLERMIAPHTALQRAIMATGDTHDHIIIDCPPGLGLPLTCALTAARWALVPVETKYLSYANVERSVDRINEVHNQVNPRLSLLGIVPTMKDSRTQLAADVIAQLHEEYDTVFDAIPHTVRLAEAPSAGEPIHLFDPSGVGHKAYAQLTRHILEMI